MIPILKHTSLLRRLACPVAGALLLLGGSAGVVFAQAGSDGTAPPIAKHSVAPVIVDGEVLLEVGGVPAYPAKRRAAEIAERILALARDESFDPKEIKVEDHDGLTEISAKGATIAVVFDEDARRAGLRRDHAAEVAARRVQEIIVQYRAERTQDGLLNMAGRVALWTTLLLTMLFVINWSFRRIDVFLEENVRLRIERLEARSKSIVQAQQIWQLLRNAVRAVRFVLILALVYFFLNYVLTLLPWTRYLARLVLDAVLGPLADIATSVVAYLPSLVYLLLLILIARYILKVLGAFFRSIAAGRIHLERFEPDWAVPTYKIARILVVALFVVLAYPYVPGSDSEAFKAVTLFLGVLMSLGSTSAISNVIAGYAMTYRRAFRVGDRIRIDEFTGDVMEMRTLVTHLRSVKNEEIVIPNSKILNSEVVNYSTLARREGIILHTCVGIGYETPWRQVEAMLLLAAQRTPGISQEPSPFVLQKALADYAVTYELNVYCRDEMRMAAAYTDLHRSIQDVFNEYGVQIMTPSYEADPSEPKIVPRENWYAAPASPPDENKGGKP